MIDHNIRKHEALGLLLIFFGASWFGFGLYATFLAANHILMDIPLIRGNELLIFPIFYGVSAVLIVLGVIELREMLPGKNRR